MLLRRYGLHRKPLLQCKEFRRLMFGYGRLMPIQLQHIPHVAAIKHEQRLIGRICQDRPGKRQCWRIDPYRIYLICQGIWSDLERPEHARLTRLPGNGRHDFCIILRRRRPLHRLKHCCQLTQTGFFPSGLILRTSGQGCNVLLVPICPPILLMLDGLCCNLLQPYLYLLICFRQPIQPVRHWRNYSMLQPFSIDMQIEILLSSRYCC